MALQCAMRILVAADSFKDALPAPGVCAAIAEGLRNSGAHTIEECPLADGGEGTLDVLTRALNLEPIAVDALDPLRRPRRVHFGVDEAQHRAFIELAQISGLQLLTDGERNALDTTTFGTGQLIAAATAYGVESIVLTIGGSATNDAGIGMAAAFGWRFLDEHGSELPPVGRSLASIRQIVAPTVARRLPKIDVLCDVVNPLFGPSGAAHVYAKQKGADDADIAQLDNGLRQLAKLVQRQHLSDVSPATPGAGAAGGVGYGAMVFAHATLERGIDYLLDLVDFDAALQHADLVITGEGRIDAQTLHGKLIHGVCRRAAQYQVPVIALCGVLRAEPEAVHAIGLHAAYCINDANDEADLLAKTAERLTATAARLSLG